MTLVVTIRPEPGGTTTWAQARENGLEAVNYPMFAVEPVAWDGPDPADVDALLIGSANGLRHGGPGIARYQGKPAYAVGAATARAATAAGLTLAGTGCGGLQALLAELAPGHRRLLRLSGRAPVVLRPPAGVAMAERVVYDSMAMPMPHDLARLLSTQALAGSVVMLHSAEAAQHFAQSCDLRDIPRRRVRLAALGPRIAAAAGAGWAEVAIAERPADMALLAVATQMCQSAPTLRAER